MIDESTDNEPVVNPHDAYVESVFRQTDVARGFFLGYLAPEVSALFDWQTLQLKSANFVTDELGRQYADLLFSVRLRGSTIDRRVRLLFEHKFDVRYKTPRQVHGYISRQFEDTPLEEPLPPIITVMLLQSGTWRRSAEFAAEYDLPAETLETLKPYLVNFRLEIVSLEALEQNEIVGEPEGRFALALLKSIGARQPTTLAEYEEILDEVFHEEPERLRRILARGSNYLASTTSSKQFGEIRRTLRELPKRFKLLEKNMITVRHFASHLASQNLVAP